MYITAMVVNAETTVRKLVSLPRELVQAIEDFRYRNRIPSEAEAMRRLLHLGLTAAAKAPPAPPKAR